MGFYQGLIGEESENPSGVGTGYVRSRRLCDRLDRVLGAPAVQATRQGRRVDPEVSELLRHTDAGSFVRSSAVGNDRPVGGLTCRPFSYVIGQ